MNMNSDDDDDSDSDDELVPEVAAAAPAPPAAAQADAEAEEEVIVINEPEDAGEGGEEEEEVVFLDESQEVNERPARGQQDNDSDTEEEEEPEAAATAAEEEEEEGHATAVEAGEHPSPAEADDGDQTEPEEDDDETEDEEEPIHEAGGGDAAAGPSDVHKQELTSLMAAFTNSLSEEFELTVSSWLHDQSDGTKWWEADVAIVYQKRRALAAAGPLPIATLGVLKSLQSQDFACSGFISKYLQTDMLEGVQLLVVLFGFDDMADERLRPYALAAERAARKELETAQRRQRANTSGGKRRRGAA